MPARDRDRRGAAERLRDLLAVLGDRRTIEGLMLRVELRLHARALTEVVLVEGADRAEGRGRFFREDLGRRLALQDDVIGVELVLEADPVEVLLVAQDVLLLPVRRVERAIALEHVLRALVQA